MKKEFKLEKIVQPLLTWFAGNARKLPWREEPTPYHVWVSEIMLQQTRVEAVKAYYERFLKALPDVKDLAECEEEKLLKLWEGLGYYNRVRNMQVAARTVVEQYEGNLPSDYATLLDLKGIGSYTAGAIASIAFGIPVPAVDGNVLRVITRVTGDTSDIAKASTKKDMEHKLMKIIPAHQAGVFNQALMELGALVCIPNGQPLCQKCPWSEFCQAKLLGKTEEIPVKTKEKRRRIEKRTIFVIRQENRIVLNKRPKKGLLAGMYEFPGETGWLEEKEVFEWMRQKQLSPIRIKALESAKHIFSHVEWHMQAYEVWVDELTEDKSGFLYVDIEDAKANYPIPSAFSAYSKYILS